MRHSTVKLCESDTEYGNYCALSYRWGQPETLYKTTEDNLQKMKVDIPFENLPALLQDAVTVTRSLEVPFLWIDALCIVQGSKEGKEGR